MAGYDVFARYYDALTANVDYKGRAAYLRSCSSIFTMNRASS